MTLLSFLALCGLVVGGFALLGWLEDRGWGGVAFLVAVGLLIAIGAGGIGAS